eukprot:2672945-Amphidinium_carterae.1
MGTSLFVRSLAGLGIPTYIPRHAETNAKSTRHSKILFYLIVSSLTTRVYLGDGNRCKRQSAKHSVEVSVEQNSMLKEEIPYPAKNDSLNIWQRYGSNCTAVAYEQLDYASSFSCCHWPSSIRDAMTSTSPVLQYTPRTNRQRASTSSCKAH